VRSSTGHGLLSTDMKSPEVNSHEPRQLCLSAEAFQFAKVIRRPVVRLMKVISEVICQYFCLERLSKTAKTRIG
jgi:hypothetical protein